MALHDVWFLLIAFLWVGYFLLEGFDFGVGALLPRLGRDETGRRTVLATIGPVWDGNEVWLITAAGATFAAFPEWYATLFSGFYLPLLLILVALILRGVALEYRGKGDTARWRRAWDRCVVLGSVVPAFLWGLVLANVLRGVPLDADHEYAGTTADLLSPYALLGGLVTLALFSLHGAVFTALRTLGPVRERAAVLAARTGPVTAVLVSAFLVWTQLLRGDARTLPLFAAAALALVGGVLANAVRREGWAFVGTGAAIVLTVTGLFTALYPAVLPASNHPAHGLDVVNAASTPYTLQIMSWAALAFLPLVLGYQAWTYWVFRRRVGAPPLPTQRGADRPHPVPTGSLAADGPAPGPADRSGG